MVILLIKRRRLNLTPMGFGVVVAARLSRPKAAGGGQEPALMKIRAAARRPPPCYTPLGHRGPLPQENVHHPFSCPHPSPIRLHPYPLPRWPFSFIGIALSGGRGWVVVATGPIGP
jgi:hypothetical protein